MSWIRPRNLAGLAVALVVAFTLSAAALASADSLKLKIPAHIKVGQRFTISISGFASHHSTASHIISQIQLLSDPRPCRRSYDAEAKIALTEWVTTVVHGRFRYVDRIPFAQSTHGPQHFCVYLFYNRGTTGTNITTARAGARFRVPS
jgi:hypothetical protein